MTQWMLVSREWLKIVLSIVFRDLWVTSRAHLLYIVDICDLNSSFICKLAGISDVALHLAKNCRSLTISAYHDRAAEYTRQCKELIEYATMEVRRGRMLPGVCRYETQIFAIPVDIIATVIEYFTPRITALHFVLIDCNGVYNPWDSLRAWSDHVLSALARRAARHLCLHLSALQDPARCASGHVLPRAII
ncbi:hypothetical protein B0H16DRAFT_1883996 [Mycena metata]|uniref:Uncharacterized protein n=1 Tax=Mycena metata TaxID=1033252 RepID=A0AAD7JDQ6_9AGAR|nr:hypothetical protein B0H16DRAFT_1883996 [Mycena metata]